MGQGSWGIRNERGEWEDGEDKEGRNGGITNNPRDDALYVKY